MLSKSDRLGGNLRPAYSYNLPGLHVNAYGHSALKPSDHLVNSLGQANAAYH